MYILYIYIFDVRILIEFIIMEHDTYVSPEI